MFSYTKQHNLGITLVESIVAIAILLFGVIIPVSVYTKSITDTRFAIDYVTAYMLAQEAIEEAKRQIFTNINRQVDWYRFSTGNSQIDVSTECNGGASECIIDAHHEIVCKVGSPAGCNIASHSTGDFTVADTALTHTYLDGVYSEFGHVPAGVDGFEKSRFSREIIFTDSYGGVPDNILITVKVSWEREGIVKSIELNNVMILWR